MTEQGITHGDEQWLDERWCAPQRDSRWHSDMRAAIARGYERGLREGEADRERLAKRCEELDDELTQWQFSEVPPARLSVVESRQSATDARLTALAGDVARVVGALREYDYALDHPLRGLDGVEPTIACDDDLAALRSPGMEADDGGTDWKATAEFRQAQLDECRPERDAWQRRADEAESALATARRARVGRGRK